jgi:hypothetical protein
MQQVDWVVFGIVFVHGSFECLPEESVEEIGSNVYCRHARRIHWCVAVAVVEREVITMPGLRLMRFTDPKVGVDTV